VTIATTATTNPKGDTIAISGTPTLEIRASVTYVKRKIADRGNIRMRSVPDPRRSIRSVSTKATTRALINGLGNIPYFTKERIARLKPLKPSKLLL
jgi:hypothetical protein